MGKVLSRSCFRGIKYLKKIEIFECVCLSSCWLLWLPGRENVVHENVPGEVQEVGELPSGRGPQTEDRTASTIVSTSHTWLWYYMFSSTNYSLTIFLFSTPVPRLLSQSWVTQTPRHLTPCSRQQKPPARRPPTPENKDLATIQSHPCQWAKQMTSALQVPQRDTVCIIFFKYNVIMAIFQCNNDH